MEYLGGGSCLDLVNTRSYPIYRERLLTVAAQTRSIQRRSYSDNLPGAAFGTQLLAPRGQNTP